MKIFRYALFLIVLLAASGCSNDEADEEVNEKTLLVYFPWSGSNHDQGLLYDLNNNLEQMKQGIIAGSGLDNHRVLVLMAKSTNSATLSELVYDSNKRTVNSVEIKQYNNVSSLSTREGITDVLMEMQVVAPALNYAFITGGHGCGWTPALAWESYPTRSFGSITDFQNYGIDVSTLASAIKDAGIKMQYILFDNCYMANVETAYDLKDVTNFMIASTTEILSEGLPYAKMWSQLIATAPNYKTITSTPVEYYKNSSSPYSTMTAVDCRNLDKLAEYMKQLNQNYSFNEDNRNEVQILDGYSPTLFYDMRSYVAELCGEDEVEMRNFDNILSGVIRSEAHTERGYTAVSPAHTFTLTEHCGLSISDISKHPVAEKSKTSTSWWLSTH